MRGVRRDVEGSAAGPMHQLYYIAVDVAEQSLEFYPGFLDWATRHKPMSVLLKSASYRLHDRRVEETRTMILTSADFVIQDGTGIPDRFLQHPPWQVRLYGRYRKPIKDFSYGYQADLDSAYRPRAIWASFPSHSATCHGWRSGTSHPTANGRESMFRQQGLNDVYALTRILGVAQRASHEVLM